jgi:hypothetical protein
MLIGRCSCGCSRRSNLREAYSLELEVRGLLVIMAADDALSIQRQHLFCPWDEPMRSLSIFLSSSNTDGNGRLHVFASEEIGQRGLTDGGETPVRVKYRLLMTAHWKTDGKEMISLRGRAHRPRHAMA